MNIIINEWITNAYILLKGFEWINIFKHVSSPLLEIWNGQTGIKFNKVYFISLKSWSFLNICSLRKYLHVCIPSKTLYINTCLAKFATR